MIKLFIQSFIEKNDYLFVLVTSLIKIIRKPKSIFSTKIYTTLRFKEIRIDNYRNTFFGYYDISPFNPIDENLLLLHANNTLPFLKPNKSITKIILYNLQKNNYKLIGETRCWNWQQGSRLQWIDGERVIYNDFNLETGKFISIINNIRDGSIEEVDCPVQSLHKDEFFISIDYSKLRRLNSEYQYQYLEFDSSLKNSIVHYDLKTKIRKVLFNLDDVKDIMQVVSYLKINNSYFNHVLISPSGRQFIFIQRSIIKNKRYDHLLLYDLITNRMTSLQHDAVISHATWANDLNLLIWMVIDNIAAYYLINIKDLSFTLVYKTDDDGHPSYVNSDIFLTDSYPDSNFRQYLYTFNANEEKKAELASFFHPPIYGKSTRCDLHPSLSPSRNKIQVDTISGVARKAIIINGEF